MIGLLAAAAPVAAKATQVGAQAPSSPSLFGAVFALLLVLVLIVGLGWLLKRMPGSGFRSTEGLRVVTSLAVGAKERVVVVEVNGQQLLLGVTAGGISTLHTLPEPLPTAPAPTLPAFKQLPNFAQLLAQKLRKDP
ncbi:flagellar protein [Xanthomonas citri pv. fuscans]|uniref:Flagellar protein n=3 Tax=Xanthomonas TaxID=338 RepID=A0AB34Q4N0_XANCI|nr:MULTISPECIES: flagellar biosynthetic protein FliO [Xanthomonas]ATS63669.1 flagellar biosynthetic protein FliO [Xanthomonas citri pv. phaseoli var. fuscans]ATS68856.1 flagellar biosynthetic protein FliO [Xanthomonas citri pv. phaseoli var. fuscans]ATS71266.1 flagellar biosynthetic protein FliO [Xanthomonas citri pv. phaseoli var. fuscans]ATS77849.1 flagellar biosynthetic protein FliO [Xanthomonas citri pv. phaseoli var. fuscans]ATS80161.1 flagellar biosynthetic protein FliO [Xanthomonas citr